jgi:hypothetical protein
MKRLSILFLLLFTSLNLSAHEFFFSYAEFEVNELSGELQGTVIFTGHDMEKALGLSLMADAELDSLTKERLMAYINSHLSFGADIQLSYFGHEIKNTGEFYLYLFTPISADFTLPKKIRFDVLMDHFVGQQNKLTLNYRGEKYHLVFLNHEKEQSLLLQPTQHED